MEILVSVIIPTRNRAKQLENAIGSVLQQTINNVEIIIIDDASTDDTSLVLKKFPQITVIRNTVPLGGSQSRNIGINRSRGLWIAFLDDDDTWYPDKLATQLENLKHHPEAIACTSGYIIHYPLNITRKVYPPTNITLDKLLLSNSLGGASVCICKASVLKQIGGFDSTLKSAQDWDVWIKLCMAGKILSIDNVLVNYFVHFNYRISNDMKAKYLGARRFYTKYRSMMNHAAKIKNIAFLCFIKSRQNHRTLWMRLWYLRTALHYSDIRTKYSYILSSLPRIILQVFI